MVTGPCCVLVMLMHFTYIWYYIFWELGLIDSPLRCEFCIFVKSAIFDRCLDVSRGLPVVENQDLVSAKHRVCEQNVMKQFHILKYFIFQSFSLPSHCQVVLITPCISQVFQRHDAVFSSTFTCLWESICAHFGHILRSFYYMGIKL